MSIQIIPANNISNMISQNEFIVDDYMGNVVNQYDQILPLANNFPKNVTSNVTTFQIPTGTYSIAINQSYLEMTNQLTYHFGKSSSGDLDVDECSMAWLINGLWWHADYTVVATNGTTMPILNASTSAKPNPYCVGTGPLHAMNLFQESNFNYSSAKVQTYQIYEKTNYYAAKVSGDSSNMDLSTWFFSNNPYDPVTGKGDAAIFFDGRPQLVNGTWMGATAWLQDPAQLIPGSTIDKRFTIGSVAKTSAALNYNVTIFHTTKVPIAYLSDVFLQDNELFYANAVSQSWMNLQIKFRNYDLARLMGKASTGSTSGLLNNVSQFTSGHALSPNITNQTYASCITSMKLHLYTKQSNLFNSDLQARDVIVQRIQTCSHTTMTNVVGTGGYNMTLTQPNKSIQDIMFCISPNDTNEVDSIHIHGLQSFFRASEIVSLANNGFRDFPVIFPYQMQMQLPPTNANLINGRGGLQSLQDYINTTLGALRLLGNNYASPCPLLKRDLWAQFMQIFIINVESFRGQLLTDNVIQDGMDTRGRGIIFKYDSLGLFDPRDKSSDGLQSVQKATDSSTGYQTLQSSYFMNCYYFNEAFTVFYPVQNRMLVTEDIEQFMQ